MKRLVLLIAVTLLTAGCVAVPAYDNGPYYGYYDPYPYGYWWGPDFVFVSGFHGHDHDHAGFHGRSGFNGGGHSFHAGGGFHGGGGGGGRR